MRTLLHATATPDAAIRMNPCDPLDNDRPGRTAILAQTAPHTFLRFNYCFQKRRSGPAINFSDSPLQREEVISLIRLNKGGEPVIVSSSLPGSPLLPPGTWPPGRCT